MIDTRDVQEDQYRSENIYDVRDMIILDQENIYDVLDKNDVDQNKVTRSFLSLFISKGNKSDPHTYL